MSKKQIAFVSDRNSCRSIIASALALKMTDEKMNIQSFGIRPDRVNYMVQEVMAEKGYNMTFFFSKDFEVVARQKFDIIVAMDSEVAEQLPKIPFYYQLVKWQYEDPTREGLSEEELKAKVIALYDALEKEVRQFIETLNKEAAA